MAGIVAARDLAAEGHHVALIEARDRLGGRVFTDAALGTRLEMGGGYIHWTQANVWREMKRYGLETRLKMPLPPEKLFWLADGVVHEQALANRHGLAQPLLERMTEDARNVFPEPFKLDAEVGDVQDESLAERIDKMQLSMYERDVLEGALSGIVHDFRLHGSLQLLHGVSTHMGQVLSFLEAAGTWSCDKGLGELIDAMVADSKATVQFGAAVTDITDDGSKVSITTADGKCKQAKAVVVALPINTLAHVSVSPPLPSAALRMLNDGNPVRASKIWALVKGHIAPFAAMAPPGKHPISAIRVEKRCGDNTLVLCMCADADAVVSGESQLAALQSALRRFTPDIEVLEVACHNWNEDSFSQGGWMMHRPGHFLNGARALREVQGRVIFAGSDIATMNTGFIEGAMSSGAAAAKMALQRYQD